MYFEYIHRACKRSQKIPLRISLQHPDTTFWIFDVARDVEHRIRIPIRRISRSLAPLIYPRIFQIRNSPHRTFDLSPLFFFLLFFQTALSRHCISARQPALPPLSPPLRPPPLPPLLLLLLLLLLLDDGNGGTGNGGVARVLSDVVPVCPEVIN